MKDKEALKERLANIKNEDNVSKAIAMLADVQYEIAVVSCREIKSLSEQIRALQIIISGNGSPSESLLARLEKLEKFIDQVIIDITIIKVALIGDLSSDPVKKGIVGRLVDVEKVTGALTKATWILVGSVLAQVVLKILGLF